MVIFALRVVDKEFDSAAIEGSEEDDKLGKQDSREAGSGGSKVG
jgi:hypothetical protein